MYILLMDEELSGIFCDVNQTQKNWCCLAFTDLLGNRRSWLVFLIGNFDPFCVSRFVALELQSSVACF